MPSAATGLITSTRHINWTVKVSLENRRPASPPSRSPRTTGVASLAVAPDDRHRLPCGRHGRPASPPSRSPRATGTRLPRGRHGRPVPRLSGSPRGDQLFVLPGRHGAVGAMLTDNAPVMFNIPLMLPLDNYNKTTKVHLSTNSNGPHSRFEYSTKTTLYQERLLGKSSVSKPTKVQSSEASPSA
ncbi:hypothetical protein DY000_02031334 [Brassica cretica]|uniref:Uncharacterized protein n=1 Tax=Brassica cretica TaxID=69181 RepID=A0ABQ7DQ84_BRACR|nr:hypothetical protein DY000_02031334 [Brassica cretica]